MAKKPNPWAKGLKKKKAPVDLHPDVLRAVLRVNPDLRGGDRSTEQVAEGLMDGLPGKAPGPMSRAEGQLKRAFDDLLRDMRERVAAQLAECEQARTQLALRETQIREESLAHIADFLAEKDPGAVSQDNREVLQRHYELRRLLRAEISDINSLVVARSRKR